jgi:hypothetical protein
MLGQLGLAAAQVGHLARRPLADKAVGVAALE